MNLPREQPAFPTTIPEDDEFYARIAYGMSLRDYFAAKVMSALCINARFDGDQYTSMAARSYVVADCMLAEREKAVKP